MRVRLRRVIAVIFTMALTMLVVGIQGCATGRPTGDANTITRAAT